MSVYVKFMYPVMVEVDLDAAEVTRVVVLDECPSPAIEVNDDSLNPVPEEIGKAARDIVENAMWPAWDFGW